MNRPSFSVLIAVFGLFGCSTAPSDAKTTDFCLNETLEDLEAFSPQKLERQDFFFVPKHQQEEALEMVGLSGAAEISTETVTKFGATNREGTTSYLIRACFFAAYEYSGFDPVYYAEKNVIVAYSFGLASRTAKPWPAALIFWSESPVTEVRVVASAAE